ncbi:PQQ-binding-like beta-propeller repeat protein [bacterium]|nr:PQQ-binding-like beta-propeller repeat protein [bacterium]
MSLSRCLALLLLVSLAIHISCSAPGTAPLDGPVLPAQGGMQSVVPAQLPVDSIQPWESADGRYASATGADSLVLAGSQRYLESGTVTDYGQASRLHSGASGPAWAMYRLGMSGMDPGIVSIDANRIAGQGFYVGLSDYAHGRWQWRGPISEGQLRLATAGEPGLLSPLGNLFIVVLAAGESTLDLVCVAADPLDPLDQLAPPVPDGLHVTALQGGLLLGWDAISADDLAGYRIHYATRYFTNPESAGVTSVLSLQGRREMLLPLPAVTHWLRVSAIDRSGNSSAPSGIVSGRPLPGAPLPLEITVSAASGGIGEAVQLSAAGAVSFDYDTDGDGEWDVINSPLATVALDTSLPGVLRPAVRAHGVDGTMQALAVLSVLLSANGRPVALALASPSQGEAPLAVSLDATQSTDPDGSITGGGWDFDGDGSYDAWSDDDFASVAQLEHVYTSPGLYNLRLRVVDNHGNWDVDSLAILVGGQDPANQLPVAVLTADHSSTCAPFTVSFDASASSDADGNIVQYEWDPDGDGSFEESGGAASCTYTYPERGTYIALLRVTDDRGATATASMGIALPGQHAMDGLDYGMRRRSPFAGPDSATLAWTYDTGAAVVNASPAIGADGTVYIGSDNNALHAIRPDGTERWTYTTTGWVESPAAITDDGTLVFGCGDDRLYVVSPVGQLLGMYSTLDWISGGALVWKDGRVIFGGWDSRLRVLRPDGTLHWSFVSTGSIRSSPAVDSAGNIYFGCVDGNLYSLDLNGALRWTFPAGDDLLGSPAVDDDGNICFGSLDGKLYCLSADGSEQWTFTAGGPIHSAPAIGWDGTVLFGCDDNKLYALHPDGSLDWSFPTGGDILADPLVDVRGVTYIGSLDNTMYAVNPDGTQLWKYTTGHDVRSNAAISADHRLYFGSWDTNVYCIGE